MIIEKIFSEQDTNERIYSVLMDEEELNSFNEFKESLYADTLYDHTDRLKLMKDSDILAEDSRSNFGSYKKVAHDTIHGALSGAAIAPLAAAVIEGAKGKSGKAAWEGLLKKGLSKEGLAKGAGAGAAIEGIISLKKGRNERDINRQYNKRLKQAKKLSKRREQKDWENNITNREGYTY